VLVGFAKKNTDPRHMMCYIQILVPEQLQLASCNAALKFHTLHFSCRSTCILPHICGEFIKSCMLSMLVHCRIGMHILIRQPMEGGRQVIRWQRTSSEP
jgi:hypothetical protein